MTVAPRAREPISHAEAVAVCRWMLLDAAGKAGEFGGPVSAVVVDQAGSRLLVPELTPGEAARALCGDAMVKLEASSAVLLPEGLDDALALLAPDLAAAQTALANEVDQEAPAAVAFVGYSLRSALLHVEILEQFLELEVTVIDPSPLRRAVAEAFGASAREPKADASPVDASMFVARDVNDVADLSRLPRIDLHEVRTPGLEGVEHALETITTAEWRYRPLLTSVAARCLGETLVDPHGEVASAVLL